MFRIEFNKILKRKTNYIFFLVSSIVFLLAGYKQTNIASYLTINQEEYFYSYNMKFILIFSLIYAIANIIFSYRKDYKDRVNLLIKNSNRSVFTNLISKVMITYIMSVIIYIIFLLINITASNYNKITSIKAILLKDVLKYNLILSLSLIFLVVNLSLLVVVLFNKSKLSLAITILLITAVTHIRALLKNIYNIELGKDVFSSAFSIISFNVNSTYLITLQIIGYSLALFIFSIVVKLIKDN